MRHLQRTKFKTDTAISKQLSNKENDNKLNNSQKKPEIIFKINSIEKENDFLGKKRKPNKENENTDLNKDIAAIEIKYN